MTAAVDVREKTAQEDLKDLALIFTGLNGATELAFRGHPVDAILLYDELAAITGDAPLLSPPRTDYERNNPRNPDVIKRRLLTSQATPTPVLDAAIKMMGTHVTVKRADKTVTVSVAFLERATEFAKAAHTTTGRQLDETLDRLAEKLDRASTHSDFVEIEVAELLEVFNRMTGRDLPDGLEEQLRSLTPPADGRTPKPGTGKGLLEPVKKAFSFPSLRFRDTKRNQPDTSATKDEAKKERQGFLSGLKNRIVGGTITPEPEPRVVAGRRRRLGPILGIGVPAAVVAAVVPAVQREVVALAQATPPAVERVLAGADEALRRVGEPLNSPNVAGRPPKPFVLAGAPNSTAVPPAAPATTAPAPPSSTPDAVAVPPLPIPAHEYSTLIEKYGPTGEDFEKKLYKDQPRMSQKNAHRMRLAIDRIDSHDATFQDAVAASEMARDLLSVRDGGPIGDATLVHAASAVLKLIPDDASLETKQWAHWQFQWAAYQTAYHTEKFEAFDNAAAALQTAGMQIAGADAFAATLAS